MDVGTWPSYLTLASYPVTLVEEVLKGVEEWIKTSFEAVDLRLTATANSACI